jgi:hypothetical protein
VLEEDLKQQVIELQLKSAMCLGCQQFGVFAWTIVKAFGLARLSCRTFRESLTFSSHTSDKCHWLITAHLEMSTELPTSDQREAAVQDMWEVSKYVSLTQNYINEVFGREGRPGSGTLASPISPNIPPMRRRHLDRSQGKIHQTTLNLQNPYQRLWPEICKWGMWQTSFAASSTGAHFDTTATLKLFELLRGVREQVQIALWDIHVAIPEVSPGQAQINLDKMMDELESRAS